MTTDASNQDFPAFLPWLLACGIALVLMSTDIYAPCLPSMVNEFIVCEADIQWTLSINSFGYCLASPFVGPLSDSYGRRPVIIVSLVFFVIACLGCAASPTLFFFDVWRFLQGMCSAAIPIVSVAIMADLLQGRRFASMMAYIGIVITLAFAVGPMIGGFIGELFGWRVLFYGLAGVGALMVVLYRPLLPETLKIQRLFSIPSVLKTYGSMLKDPIFMLYGLMTAFILTGFFSYITSSSYLYINEFGLSQSHFGYITGCGMLANAAAHLVVGRLTLIFGVHKILRAGITFLSSAVVTMAWMTLIDVQSSLTLLVPVMLYNIALGFSFPPTSTQALERFRHATGTASAFLAGLRMIFLGGGSFLAGKVYNGTLISISSIFVLFGSLTVICYLWAQVLRRREERTV